jgi:hypothetical protein
MRTSPFDSRPLSEARHVGKQSRVQMLLASTGEW